MKRTDAKATQWLFLVEAEIHVTHAEQVMKQNVLIQYSLSAIMRCSQDKKQYKDVVECFLKHY